MRAAIYARTAVEDQASVQTQLLHCLNAAKTVGWSVDPEDVYCDTGISGLQCDKMNSLRRLLLKSITEPPPFDCVIAADLMRFGRDMARVSVVIRDLRSRGITLHVTVGFGLEEVQP